MGEHPSILLVYERSAAMDQLKSELNKQSIQPARAHTCEQARHLMDETEPHLVFTEVNLPDGTWADLVRFADKSASSANIIVVSALADMKLYVRVIEHGAFDFVTPPFESFGLGHVVRSAMLDAVGRRSERTVAAVH